MTTTLVSKMIAVLLDADSAGILIYDIHIKLYNSMNYLTAAHYNQPF